MLVRRIHFALPAFALLAGAAVTTHAGAQSVQVITPSPIQPQVIAPAPVQTESAVVVAPTAPPAPRFETIPPPPTAEAQEMYWRPGHWLWSGANWEWSSGHYVQRPQPEAVWEAGHWSEQPSGGYVWVDGHWRG